MGKRKQKNRPIITIGTDPEFALTHIESGKLSVANSHSIFRSDEETARIGCDGAGTPIELRPHPTEINNLTPMLKEIREDVYRIAKYIIPRKLIMKGGGVVGTKEQSVVIGGHIHFGSREFQLKSYNRNLLYRSVSERVNSERNRLASEDFDVEENIKKLTRSLDTYFNPIANFFIGNHEIHKRRLRGYGKIGDHRSQRWGIEYRTPYSFLLSPLLTTGLYSLSCLIVYNYKKICPNKNLYKETVFYYDLLQDTDHADKIQKNIYKKIKPKLIDVMKYNSPNPQYNGHILSLFNLIEQGKTCKNRDVLANYNITEEAIPPFMIYYASSDGMRLLRRHIESKIDNVSKGELYIYRLDYDYDTDGKVKKLKISKGMPKIEHKKTEIEYISGRRGGGHKYSIGISSELIKDLQRNKESANYLIKYINKLRLR